MSPLDARARLVFHYAREEADRLGHAVIESEHLLLGLLREGGIAAQVLNTCGLTLEAARFRVVELIGRFERSRDAPPPAITALAKRVMDLAGAEASRYQSPSITTGHVLLGLIHAGDGVAMGIINQIEGGTQAVRRLTLTTLNLPPDEEGGIENSGLSGIVAAPADSVLGRLSKSDAAVVPPASPAVVIASEVQMTDHVVMPTPEPVVIMAPEPPETILQPEPTIQESTAREPIREFELAFAEPVSVVSPGVPIQIAVTSPKEPTRADSGKPISEPLEAQLKASEPEQPAAFAVVPDSGTDEFVKPEPMVSQPPTPAIEARTTPFMEKIPTLDLDIIPESPKPTPIQEAAPVSNFVPVGNEEDFPESLLIDEAFIEVPPEPAEVTNEVEAEYQSTTLEDQDLIPIELDDSEAKPAHLSVVQEFTPLSKVEADSEPKIMQYEQQIAQNLVDTEPPISPPEPKLILDEPALEAVFGTEDLALVSSQPVLASLPSEPVPESLPSQPETEPVSKAFSDPKEAVETAQHDTTQVSEASFVQAKEPEKDLISSVAEFEAISSEATKMTPTSKAEILLDLTKELDTANNVVLKTAAWDMVTAASVTKRQIIALGGGGFSQEPGNLLLDQYVLEHARSAREVTVPRVCFVPTAAGDSQMYIDRFYSAFNTLECEPYHLPLFKTEDWHDDLEDMILGADVLYFSEGSTKNALALWKAWELEPVFLQAYEAGTVFTGVSAGAICWFEQFITDSLGRSLGAMKGLGWLPGSFTPHYDSERYRKTILERLLRSRKVAPGFAADDGVAVHFINSEYARAISSRPEAKAYHVTLGRNRLVESPLETLYLG
ncbi:MAG: Type 1 glutamine amidotransferase-like domain-containing protein [Deinococcales bacterium]